MNSTLEEAIRLYKALQKADADCVAFIKRIDPERLTTIGRDIKDVIGITVKVTLVPPGTIPRSEGKAKRFIDNRPK